MSNVLESINWSADWSGADLRFDAVSARTAIRADCTFESMFRGLQGGEGVDGDEEVNDKRPSLIPFRALR